MTASIRHLVEFLGADVAGSGARLTVIHGVLGSFFFACLADICAQLADLRHELAPAGHEAGGDPAERGAIHVAGNALLMALAVVSLLALVLPLTLTGFATYNDWGDFLGRDWLEELHEFFGNAFFAVVLAHLVLIAGLSALRRKNQAQAMLTGYFGGAGPDLVKHIHARLAALLMIAVLVFGAWQWQQAPDGLLPTQGSSDHVSVGEEHGD